MKKVLKILAATAALASVIPFHSETDENGGTMKALLWKAKWTRDPDYHSDPEVNINIGFNNPFEKKHKEADLFADELVADYCCDDTMTYHYSSDTPDVEYDNVNAVTAEDSSKSCACGENCACGEECTCDKDDTCGEGCTCTE